MNTSKKLPFWQRRVDVVVAGKAAAEQHTEFNWRLLTVPLYWLMLTAAGVGVIWTICLVFSVTVSLVKAFPVIAAIVLIGLLFKR
ncbi:hypothetical protein WT83_30470 [Burkholderia territorii]|uniref:Uncharacterized protein n=1 Tax=Burkholderia territorii TaxID=1503055 RepID=A0A108E514_9BURK|nr:hypothetical protein [Burkholderia territorii]KWN04822.1 hypothetical protein WT83_30470 [Burkholderia territorii]